MSEAFDEKLITAAFALGADKGWNHVSVAAAARAAGLDLADARLHVTGCWPILKRFGRLADSYALAGALTEGAVKDRLFDILLRRFDYLQLHRAGVVALLRSLPLKPELVPWLAEETLVSMGWILEAAGVSATGWRGQIRKRGLAAVWAWGMRAWLRDESADLSATMAAVDVALSRADQIAARFSDVATAPEASQDIAEPELPLDTPD